MEAGQAPLESSEAVKARNPADKAPGDDSATGSGLLGSVDGGGENGLRASTNGKEGLGDDGFVELVRTRVVRTEILSVESSFAERNDFAVLGTDCVRVMDSEVHGGVGESGSVDGRGSDESVKGMNVGSGVEEVKEASDGVFEDLHDVPIMDSAAGDGIEEIKDSKTMELEGANVFFVGDFVWGKVKNYPWWPGQIHDPSDASESAAKHNQKGRFLVAFSDGSFTWCNSSQLKPFEDDFEEMMRQSNSRSFVSSLNNALNDIGKLVELELTCPCVLNKNQAELDRPLAKNTGIKEGVCIPERRSKCSITEFEPVEFIENLKNVAQVASVNSMLDLFTMRGTLCAFYQAKGGYKLPGFYEPQQIPGLEDKMEEGALDIVIHDGAVEVPVQGPFEEEMLSHLSRGALGYGESSLTGSHNLPGSRENQLHQRKQKSIAEIIANGGTGSDNLASKSGRKKRKASGEVKDGGVDTLVSVPMMIESEVSGPFATPGSNIVCENGGNGAKKRGRKKKGDSEVSGPFATPGSKIVSENGGSEAKKRGRKKKEGSDLKMKESEVSGPFATPMSKVVSENGGSEAKKRGRKKKVDSISNIEGRAFAENDHVQTEREVHAESKEQNEKGYASRERKKSKYLSPPYTNPIQRPQKEALETESQQMTRSTGHATESPFVKCSGEVLHTNPSEQPSLGHDSLNNTSLEPMPIELPVNDVLSEIRSIALFTLHPEEKAIDGVIEFLCMYRKSTYFEGSHYQAYNQQQPGEGTKYVSPPKRRSRKRKSINSKAGLLGEHLNQNGDNIVPHSKSLDRGKKKNNETARPRKPKSREAAVTSDSERKGESPGPASLFMTFGPGSLLPAKSELIALYREFGDLVEDETDVFYNNFCARVVFVRACDAEKAFWSSHELSPFGNANVKFRLRNTLSLAASKASSSPNRRIKTTSKSSALEASNGEASEHNFIKEKLETMMVMVEQSDGKMSPNLKSTLEGEMRGLLEKMNNMG